MLNQGSFPKMGCNHFRGSFFFNFLEKQKSKIKTIKNIMKYLAALDFLMAQHVKMK